MSRIKWMVSTMLSLLLLAACAQSNERLGAPSEWASLTPEEYGALPEEETMPLESQGSFSISQDSEGDTDRTDNADPEPAAEGSGNGVHGNDTDSLPPPGEQESAEPQAESGTPPISGPDELFQRGGQPADASPEARASAQTTKVEQELLLLINDERETCGLDALGIEESLQFAAQFRAQEALESLSHTRPDGTPYHTVFDEAGFPYAGKWHGENLALIRVGSDEFNESAVATALCTEWMKSSGHVQNMLSEHFVQTGISVVIQKAEDGYTIGAAQLFAGL